ncbi:hypothetical protein [Clostridium cibarium]|uniref:Phage capsid family protein n=1 Tax=Clostridium cibarium TaxID=2762247 RepID=A0ABR8PNI6_9CLOT|nr:hypothetical protein [Clostridium cibarium]MBD7909739.1 hypothetical protein [Clostridium cibarium]
MSIIIPEVYTQMLTEKVKGKIKISTYANDLGDLDNFASEGDSVTFPQFCALSEAELVQKGVAIPTETLNQTSTKKTIVHYGKGVEIFDIDALVGKGDFMQNAVEQQARIFASAIDKEMVKDIDTNALLKKATLGATAITEDELHGAFGLFGDAQDTDEFDAIVINSLVLPSFYKMEGFVNADKTYTTNGNGIVRNGVVGYFRGVPVVMADVGTYDSVKAECKSYILKKGALGIKKKRGLLVEVERQASLKKNNVYADEIFVVGLVNKDSVVIMRKTIA